MTDRAIDVHSVPTMTHGRVLVRQARAAAARGVLAGFHGYGETAAIQMERLQAIPGSQSWTLVSVQALHRFYDRRSGQVIASWMTHEDREDAIADNVGYVAAALDLVPHDEATPFVFAGFSQGVAMAYRAACRGPRRAAGVISVGGDVPPELLDDRETPFPAVLVVRGSRDAWYSAAKFAADTASLTARGVTLRSLEVNAGHDWSEPVIQAAAEFLDGCGLSRRV
jgi:predicted esterase